MFSNRMCCSTMLFTGHSRGATLSRIADLGFASVDIWASGYLGSQDVIGSPSLARHIDPDADDPAALRTELRSYDLSLHALSIYRCDVPAKLRRIELAAELGAECVIFCAEKVTLDRFAEETVGPVLARCEELGVKLAIENHIDRAVDTTASMVRLAEQFDSASFGYALAPPHLAALGEEPPDAVHALGASRIHSVYLWDLARDYTSADSIDFGTGEEQMPGGGKLDFERLAASLGSAGYSGRLNFGVHGTTKWSLDKIAAELRRSYTYLAARHAIPVEHPSPEVRQRASLGDAPGPLDDLTFRRGTI
jgi:sugar phosphate isomerase/epimerase